MVDYDFKVFLFRSLGVNNLLIIGSWVRISEWLVFYL